MPSTVLKKHKDALYQCEEKRRAAMLAGDAGAMTSLLSDEFCYVHASTGITEDKATYLSRLSTGKAGYLGVDMSETTSRFYGITTLQTGIVAVRMSRDGKRQSRHYRFSLLWVLRRLHWQLVLWHNTRMAD